MDLGYFFIFLVIFGITGFLVEKITGFNPYKTFAIAGAVGLFLTFLYILGPVMIYPYNADLSLERLNKWMVNGLPGSIIGDVAGTFISKITGDGRR